MKNVPAEIQKMLSGSYNILKLKVEDEQIIKKEYAGEGLISIGREGPPSPPSYTWISISFGGEDPLKSLALESAAAATKSADGGSD